MVSEIQRVSVFGYCPYSVTFPYIYISRHPITIEVIGVLVYIYSHIMKNRKENKAINTLFLDSIIISKLDKYGIRGIPLKLIKTLFI